MSKRNRLGKINLERPEPENSARSEAEAEMTGVDPWLRENRSDRVSMRVEPSIKELYKKTLPDYISVTDAIRKHMIEMIQEHRQK